MAIVGPHLVVGNGIERNPKRQRFVGFLRFSLEIVGEKNGAMQTEAVAELKVQFAAGFGPEWFYSELFERFAQHRL